MNFTVLRYETVASTNDEAADHARRGAAEGLCVIARQQTAGRGRQGRRWISEKDAGLYHSLVLRPKLEKPYLPLVTLMAGIAVHDALAGLGMAPDIKWVNDILVGDRKICGILAEAIDTSLGTAVILGIGINLTSIKADSDVAETATSIEAETGRTITPDEAAAAVNQHLSLCYDILNGENGPEEIFDQWSRRSSYYSGKQVRISADGGFIEGVTEGLEGNGALRVRTDDGVLRVIQAGDVEGLRVCRDQ